MPQYKDFVALLARVVTMFGSGSATNMMANVLPQEGILPVGWLSFRSFKFFISLVEGCGHVAEGRGGGQRRPRSGALSTAAAGAPWAHRPHVRPLSTQLSHGLKVKSLVD